VDLEGSGLDPGILGFSCFHLNSRVLTFCLKSPFLCKLRRIRVLRCALGIHDGHYSSYRSYFLSKLVTLAILGER